MYADLNKVIEVIKLSEKIVLTGHTNPDGDAIGSTFALYSALIAIGKKPIVILEDFNKKFKVIPNWDKVFNEDTSSIKPDLFISMDCGSIDRFTPKALELFHRAKYTVNIDHHASNNDFGNFNIVDKNASSTSEVMHEVVTAITTFNKDMAAAIYMGLVYDTAGFRHTVTSAKTHKIAAEIHELGVDCNFIYNSINGTHTVTEMKILQKAIDNIVIDHNLKIIYTHITLSDIEKSGSNLKEVDGIPPYLISTEGMEVAIFIYEKEHNFFKASLRSSSIDVNKVASFFGGGGHVKASGCTIKGDINFCISEILKK